MRLQTKVLALSLPLSAAFAILSAGYARHVTESIMVREMGRRLTPLTTDYAARLAVPLALGQEGRLLAHLQSAQAFAGAFFAESIDPEGLVVAHTNVIEKGSRLKDGTARRAITAPSVHIERGVSRDAPTLLISAPIWRHEEEFLLSGGPHIRLGTLRLGLPLQPTLDSARRLGWIVAAMAAVYCLFAMAFFLLLVKLILGPVEAVSEATARVAAGDYSRKVPVRTHDEIGRLADSFNIMSETLERTVVSRDRLERALSLAQAALDASADGILVVGAGLKAITYNARFFQMWGVPEELAALGDIRRSVEFILPLLENPEEFKALALQGSLDFASPERRDILRLKDGRVFERIARPFLIAGIPSGRTITLRDHTLHHQVLAALSLARDEALDAARIKAQFLASVSHELRTPLNAIVGASGLLNGTKLNREQKGYSETLSRAARALLEMIEGILDFSKIEAGRMTVEHVKLSVGAVLEGAAAMLSPQARSKGLKLNIDAGAAASLNLMGDPTRLQQVLTNLLANAVKFTETGSVDTAVHVLSNEDDSVVLEFSVHDTGIGITPQQGERLFSPFTQADATMSRRYGGTGLGLAICKSLVELMGGSIGFESVPGRGTRFWVRLKLERAAPETDRPAPATESRRRGALERPKPRDRMRVLVVDDNEINRGLFVRQLERLGCSVESTGDSDGAIAAVRSADFGMILMDCQMPGRDGLETTRDIRRLEGGQRRIPIIAVSGNTTASDQDRCHEAGMDDFLAKPVTLEGLANMLERWDRPFDEVALAAYGAVAADSAKGLESLLDGFLKDARERLSRAGEAIKQGDLKVCAAAAHAIKGASAAVGARGLRELARRIEAAASGEGPVEVLDSLLKQAAEEASRISASRPKD